MAALDIVGLGLTCVDVLVRLEDMPTWERGGRIDGMGLDGGGPAGTATCAASRLGASCGFIGTVGNDDIGQTKLQSLADNGVDASHMVLRDQAEDQVVLVLVDAKTGERVFAPMRTWGTTPVSPAELDRDYITSAKYLHLDGTNPEAALQAAKWMHEAGKQVCVDFSKTDGRPVSEEHRELARRVDVLICGSGFGMSLTGHEDRWAAAEAMLALGPRIVVQTEGEDGSYTMTTDECFHTPAFDIDVLDTTGAGDVFHGAYLVGLLKGWDLRTVALFSTAVSALKCTRLGGRKSIPSYDEVVAFLRENAIALP